MTGGAAVPYPHEIRKGDDWLAAQAAGLHTFTVYRREFCDAEGQEVMEIDLTTTSLGEAVRRFDEIDPRGVDAALCHDHRMTGTWIYPEPRR